MCGRVTATAGGEGDVALEYRLQAPCAAFPVSVDSGRTYPVPTCQALADVTDSICGGPGVEWRTDRLRVVRPIRLSPGRACLADVEYRVRAHLERDRDGAAARLRRAFEAGGSRAVRFGGAGCQALAEPYPFDAGAGAYDGLDSVSFNLMPYGPRPPLQLWAPVMRRGVIDLPGPEWCKRIGSASRQAAQTSMVDRRWGVRGIRRFVGKTAKSGSF